MGSVIANMSMSLDGYIEDARGSVEDLFGWYESGRTATTMPGDGREFRTSEGSAKKLAEAVSGTGALFTGRRLFDLTHGWGGRHPVGCPVFVVTHSAPEVWAHPDAPFTFVLDGVASAVAVAQQVAGDRAVSVASASVAQQRLALGLLDAIDVNLVPVLLGGGTPFFAPLPGAPYELEDPEVVEGTGVTHLHHRVCKGARR